MNSNDKVFARGDLDKLIYENFINKNLEDGVVVEIGGHDGGWLSVSKFFENYLSFKAVLIEPVKSLYEESKKNRPNAMHFNYAVSKQKGKTNILKSNHGCYEVSALENGYYQWEKTWELNEKEEVTCVHMSDITTEASIKYIDLFIIDTEGHELDVLETFDWNIEVGIIAIELLSILDMYPYFKEKDERCRKFLREKGFIHEKTLSGDEFWSNPNYFRKEILFN